MKYRKLVILDYSGTLCLECVRFGETERLTEALVSSGLVGLGVETPDFFWDKVVNRTWTEGSTTAVGYAPLMKSRLGGLVDVPKEKLEQAVDRFVGDYFASFRVDLRWEKTLRRLRDRPGISVLVATDHYAEATEVIMASLAALGIESRPLGHVHHENTGGFVVANSADLGYPKTDRRFWEQVSRNFSEQGEAGVILVDDFGCNETVGSAYSMWPRVLKRMNETVAHLEEIFMKPIRVITFFPIDGKAPPGELYPLERVIGEVENLFQL